MTKFLAHIIAAAVATIALGGNSMAQEKAPASLAVTVEGIAHNEAIPEEFAYCIPAQSGHTQQGGNISPAVSWSGAPAGTQSYAVIMVDPDVPAVFDDANKEGKVLPADMPRRNFYHWVLVDVPASLTTLGKGVEGAGGTAPKPAGKVVHGVRGINNFGANNGAYDGPCPPWNDERMHHYHIQVFALDVPSLTLSGNFGGEDAMKAMQGHILAQGEVVGLFTNNPKLR